MKSKYFKLKLLLFLGFIFCIIGGVGSFYLIAKGIDKAENYVGNNIKMETKEIFKTKDDIEIVDVLQFARGYKTKVTVKKSNDEYNSIEIRYNKNAKEIFADIDKENPKKINLWYQNSFKENKRTIGYNILKYEIESAIFGDTNSMFYPRGDEYIESIIIKVKNPIELVSVNSDSLYYNLDFDLIKRNINHEYYEGANFNRMNIFFDGGFNIKNYSSNVFVIEDYHPIDREYNIEVSKVPYFDIIGKSHNKYNFDVKNVEGMVKISLDGLYDDIKVFNAKNVLLETSSLDIKYKVKYKENGVEKEFIFNEDAENLEKGVVVVEAEQITIQTQDGIKKIK